MSIVPLKILLINPYHGGSHRSWAEGYRTFSQHEIHMLTLPARFWKWRMHGGAITLARRFIRQPDSEAWSPELILTTDMLDLTTFLSLARNQLIDVPAVIYMHENQLTYPLPLDGVRGPMRRQGGERDLHYAFVNFASMLCADKILFNSQYHRNVFFEALPNFLRHFPDYKELDSVQQLRSKTAVMPVGIRKGKRRVLSNLTNSGIAPLILWNQRWEYDKNPTLLFNTLVELSKQEVDFRLAICGQNFRNVPEEFLAAYNYLAPSIVHFGYAEQEIYEDLLWQAEITISTAYHEYFGISVLEAIYCRTFPILPHRLSYPEIIPVKYHSLCLYWEDSQLLDRLNWTIRNREKAKTIAVELAEHIGQFDWNVVATTYDDYFSSITQDLTG